MTITPTFFLVGLGLLFSVASLIPPWPGHYLLGIGVILIAVGVLAGAAVHV